MQFCGLAGAIGSLPYLEPEAALDLIWKTIPELPHWPQLPQRCRDEYFVRQYLAVLVEMGLLQQLDGGYYLANDHPRWPAKLTDFYTRYLEGEAGVDEALNAFASPPEAAVGFYAFINRLQQRGIEGIQGLKGQIAGPLSVTLNLVDAQGKTAYYDSQLRDLLVRALALQARWQAVQLGRFGLPVLIFIDDPAMAACGSSTHITIDRQQVVAEFAIIVDAIHDAGALAGAHSCAGVDWSIFLEAGVDILSFDASGYFPSVKAYRQELLSFLQAGGSLAWGLVPTDDRAWQITASALAVQYWDQVAELGIDPKLVWQQSLITPGCGTGMLAVDLAEHIYQLTAETAALIQAGR